MMPDTADAIVGAEYEDTVFDSEFTIVAVRAETNDDHADDEQIVVEMDYDIFDEITSVSLDSFKQDTGIHVTHVPEHAG